MKFMKYLQLRIDLHLKRYTKRLFASVGLFLYIFSIFLFSLSLFPGILSADSTSVLPSPISSSPKGNPNILIIIADDLGWADVGFHGSKIRTPNIDKLALEGIELSSFYVQPVCSQTRAALLTGRYPYRYGLSTKVISPTSKRGLISNERTLAEALKEVGYKTAIIGKWHLGHRKPQFLPSAQGFDLHIGNYCGWVDYYTRNQPQYISNDKENPNLDWHHDGVILKEEGLTTDLIADKAVTYINNSTSSPAQPFYLHVAFTAPHGPLAVVNPYYNTYSDIKDEMQRKFAAIVTSLDSGVGKILTALKQKGIDRDTIVVFTSDNGAKIDAGGNNSPFRGGKKGLYEGSLRSPTLISWPGVLEKNKKYDSLIHVVDLFPTLISVAGGISNKDLPVDGINFWSNLIQNKPIEREVFFYADTDVGAAVRKGDYKLITFKDGQKSELYDLKDDISESRNIIDAYPDVVKELLNNLTKMYLTPKKL